MHRRQFLQVSVGAVLMGAGLGFKRSGPPDYTTGDDFVLDMSHYKTENMSPAYLRACRQLKVPEKDIGNVRIFEVRTQNFEEGRIPEITCEWKRLADVRKGDVFCVLGPDSYEVEEDSYNEHYAKVLYWEAVEDAEPTEGPSKAMVTCNPVVPPPYHSRLWG